MVHRSSWESWLFRADKGCFVQTCHLRQQQSILRAGPARLNRANQYQAGPSVPCAGARQSSRALASNSAASQTTADRQGYVKRTHHPSVSLQPSS